MYSPTTGSSLVDKLLAERVEKPEWLNEQAHAAIFVAASVEMGEILKRHDILSKPQRAEAAGLINEYLSAKITSISQMMNVPLKTVLSQPFVAWQNTEALDTFKNQLSQTGFTDDQAHLIRTACEKSDFITCRLLAASRQAYEKERLNDRSAGR